MASSGLEQLDKRLDALESKVFGQADNDVEYPKNAEQMSTTLVQMNSQLDSAIAGRPKIQAFMKKLGELERLLEPNFTDRLTLSDEAKAELILAEEETLRRQASDMEKVKDLSEVLSSEHLKVTPALSSRLQKLTEVHIKQQDSAGDLSEDIKHVLVQYNSVINLLSKQFIQWEETVTQLEAAKAQKPLD